jgi:hypothetical protein
LAFEALFTVVDITTLDRLQRYTKGTRSHKRWKERNFTSLSLHPERYPKSLENHIGDIWYFIHHYNQSLLVQDYPNSLISVEIVRIEMDFTPTTVRTKIRRNLFGFKGK